MSANPAFGRPSVLLVDSFADERDIYGEFLRVSGFDVFICQNVPAALSFVREHHVDVVITRLLQPGALDGVAFVKTMKQQRNTRRIPVIVISTRIEAEVRAAAEVAGCDRFVLLPCLPDQLVSEIRLLTAHALDSDPGA